MSIATSFTTSSNYLNKKSSCNDRKIFLYPNENEEILFHTAKEQDPWLCIDLKSIFPLEKIVIHNRKNQESRNEYLKIEVSCDLLTWDIVYCEKKVFGGSYNSAPLVVDFKGPMQCRFVKITALGFTYLHLSGCELFISESYHVIHGVMLNHTNNKISESIRRSILNSRYEIQELYCIAKNISSADKILEIGAGIGFVSSYILKKFKVSSYTCVEADSSLIDLIRHHHKINNVQAQVINCILKNKLEEYVSPFYVKNDFWGSSTEKSADAQKVMVKNILFQNVLDILRPNFVICDIEGGEFDLFQDVDLSSVEKICLEVHGSDIEKKESLVEFLVKSGFKSDLPEKFSYQDIIFFYKK